MTKSLYVGLALALLNCTGCLSTPVEIQSPTPAPPTAAVETPPPVTAEQVTPQNSRQIANALLEELDREAQQNMLAPIARKD